MKSRCQGGPPIFAGPRRGPRPVRKLGPGCRSGGRSTTAGHETSTPHRDHHPWFPARLEVSALPWDAEDPWTRYLPRSPFVLLLFSGWVNRQQQVVIDYLLEENRVLRAERGGRRLRLTDDQRRRLAVKGKRSVGVASGTSRASSPPTRSSVGTAGSSPGNTPARGSASPVAPAPRRVSPPSWSAWRTRTRRGATRESAVR